MKRTAKSFNSTLSSRSPSNTGWYRWAVENIWDKRPHNCQVCGDGLGDEPAPIFFSHLLPRGSYRRYKLDERNVILNCSSCHAEWHNDGRDALYSNAQWAWVVTLYFQLRNEANGIKPIHQ